MVDDRNKKKKVKIKGSEDEMMDKALDKFFK